ncbi:uncharacterized protein LOC135846448 [Planococcus citri]|uniref:uncharacterized protein LOC135846448 n=1 Tax=Planococcus citri TaxID=170843 RepID=UPI0031F9D9EF
MEINNELLSKMLSGDSSSKVTILNWHVKNNIVALGNNHTSELSRLIVEYQRKGRIFKKSFILKVPSTHPMYSLAVRFNMYEKEYPIYTEILEEMYKIDGEHLGPKLYYADDKYSLIMKDLAASGYKMVDRLKQLDYDQCYLVLKNLAKFHGLSVKLERSSKISPAVKKILWLDNPETEEDCAEFMRNACEQMAENLDRKLGLYDKLMQMGKEGIYDRVRQEMHPNRFRFNVLNHGDCWLGNSLFKFDKYGNVKKVKMIDFQCSAWLTPAYDILFFTLSSMRYDVFERHFNFLMETYIETLNKTLRFLQCGSYSLEELYRDMDSLRLTVTVILGCQLPQTLSSHENPIDYKDFIHNGKVDYPNFNKVYKNEIYLRVLHRWMSYYVMKGFFD